MYNSSIKKLITDLRIRELAIAKNHNESTQIKNSGGCGDGTEKGGDRERERAYGVAEQREIAKSPTP
ncbi:hypothetical protein F2Q69_00045142 [Brassica cretica]|uniref:Uncharacterized protein n=1 Tax=Brassica cretica TaxID=69181 RepID=A0A8S9NKF9_BRACR|nr:hypothetical protein F2Q69_00045142 [Brassica cretica]